MSKATPVEMFLGANWQSHLRPEREGATAGKVDFVMAIGDDRSDEEMFMAVDQLVTNPEGAVPVHGSRSSSIALFLKGFQSV